MTEFAFFRLPGGQAWLGEGPFTESAEPPLDRGAFYINDFDLSDPLPWKTPAHLHEVDENKLAIWSCGDAPAFSIQWEKPLTDWFKMAFRRIRREVLAGRLDKMVPVLTEEGSRLQGRPEQLLPRLVAAPDNVWGYAYANADRGFLGGTPELLFQQKDKSVDTMALAGTAKPGDRQAFLTDVKEIEEHEIVAAYLEERLSDLGKVARQARQLFETSGLLHFQTLLHVDLKKSMRAEQLVRWLHPTPAVGCLPRQEEWLAKLREYRTQLQAPGFFGAPFGFSIHGEQHIVVAIRGIGWEGEKVLLPSGCGIVGGSAFDHEWRELRLKREAVLSLLGL